MPDAIGNQLASTGHATNAVVVKSGQSIWRQAGSGSPTTNWGVIAQVEKEADALMEEFNRLVELDPEGAAASRIGQIYLVKYGFLLDKKSGYPCTFCVHDVIQFAPWIIAQLVAEEYFEGGPESSPFTPEAFLNFDFSDKGRRNRTNDTDPFLQNPNERPDVTIEAMDSAGKPYLFNLNPRKTIRIKPQEGFIEHGA